MPWNFEESVDTLDAVPEEYRPGYAAAEGGKFAVKPEFKPFFTTINGNSTALTKSRSDLAKANKESADRRGVISAFEKLIAESGLTVDEGEQAHEKLRAHLDDLTSKAKNGGELKVNLDNLRKQFEKDTAAIKADSDTKLGKMKGTLEKHLVGDVAKSALTKHEGNSTLLLPIIKSNVKVVEDGEDYAVRVMDAEGGIRIDTKTGQPMTIEAFVAEMKTNPDYAAAFKSTTNGGSGARQQTKTTVPNPAGNRADLTPTQKISAGLGKGQFERGTTRT